LFDAAMHLFAIHRDVVWSHEAQAYTIPSDVQDHDFDVVVDPHLFASFTTKH
jgi:hypothetical protein